MKQLYHISSFLENSHLTCCHDTFDLSSCLADNVAAEYLGGKLSDNQWGIIIRVSDRVMLQDYDIVGSSKPFFDHLVQNNRPLTLCSSSDWRHEGIMMMSAIWQTGDLDPALGLRLRSVNISGFDKEKQWYPNCMSTEVRYQDIRQPRDRHGWVPSCNIIRSERYRDYGFGRKF